MGWNSYRVVDNVKYYLVIVMCSCAAVVDSVGNTARALIK